MLSAEMLKGDATTPRKQRLLAQPQAPQSFSSSPPPSPSKRFNSSHRTTASPLSPAAVGHPASGQSAEFSKKSPSPDNTIKLPLAHQSLIVRKYFSNGGVTVGALDRFLNTELKIVLTDYDDVDAKEYMHKIEQRAADQLQSHEVIQPDELLLLISDIVTGERRRRNNKRMPEDGIDHRVPVGQSPKKITWGEGGQRADPLLLNEVGHNGLGDTFFSSSTLLLSPSSYGQACQEGLVQPRRTASDLTEAALRHLHKELSPRSHSKSKRRKRRQQKKRRDEERRANKQGEGMLKNESNNKNNNNTVALVDSYYSSSSEDSVSSSSIARYLLLSRENTEEAEEGNRAAAVVRGVSDSMAIGENQSRDTFINTRSHFSRSIVFKKILPALNDKRGAALAANAFIEALQEEQTLGGERRGSEFGGGGAVKASLPLRLAEAIQPATPSTSSSCSSDNDNEEYFWSSSDDHDENRTSFPYDTITKKRKATVDETSRKEAATVNSREALRNFLKPVGGRDGRTIIGAFRAIGDGGGGENNYNASSASSHAKKAREKSLLILAALSDSDRYDYQELKSQQQQQQAFATAGGAGGNYSSYSYSSNTGGKTHHLAKNNGYGGGGGGSATASGSAVVTDRTTNHNASMNDGQGNAAHPSTFEEKLSQLERLLLGDDAEEDIEELYPITASEIAAKCVHHGLPHGTASALLERLDPHRQGLVTFSTFKDELLKDCKRINLMPSAHLLMVHGHHHGDVKRIDKDDDDDRNHVNTLTATTAAPQQAHGGVGTAIDLFGRTNSTFGLSVRNAETATSTSRSARVSDTAGPRPQDSVLLPTTVGPNTTMNASGSSSQLLVMSSPQPPLTGSLNKDTSGLHGAKKERWDYSVVPPPPPPLSSHKSKGVLEKSETVVPNPPVSRVALITNEGSKQTQSSGHMFLVAELIAHCYPFCIERLCGRRVLELLLSTSALVGGTRGGFAALRGYSGGGRGPLKPSTKTSLLWNSAGSEDNNKSKKTKAKTKTKKVAGRNQHGHHHDQKTTDQHRVGEEIEHEDAEDEEEANRKKAQEELAALLRTATIEGRPVNMKAKRKLYFATLPRYMLPRIADDEHSLNRMERVHYRRQRVLRKRLLLEQQEEDDEQPENSQKRGGVPIGAAGWSTTSVVGSGYKEEGTTIKREPTPLRNSQSPRDRNRFSGTSHVGQNSTTSIFPMRGSIQLMESLRSPFFTTPKLFGARVQAGTALVPCAPPSVITATAQRFHKHEKEEDEKEKREERTTPRHARHCSSLSTSEEALVLYGSRPLACRTTPRPCTAREWTEVVEKGRGQSREHALTELFAIQPASASGRHMRVGSETTAVKTSTAQQRKNGGFYFLTQKTSSPRSSHGGQEKPVTGDSRKGVSNIRTEDTVNPSCWTGGVSPRRPTTSGIKQPDQKRREINDQKELHNENGDQQTEKKRADEGANPLILESVDGTDGNEKEDFKSDSIALAAGSNSSSLSRPHTAGVSSAHNAPHLPKPHPQPPSSSTSLPQARSVYSARVKRNHYGLTAANALYPLGNKKRDDKEKESHVNDDHRSPSVSGSNTTHVNRADPDLEESQTHRDTTAANISLPERKPFIPRPPHLLGRGERGGVGNNNNNGGSGDGCGEKFESLVKGMLSEHGIRTH